MWWNLLFVCPFCRAIVERAAMANQWIDIVAMSAVLIGSVIVLAAVVSAILPGSEPGRKAN